MITALAACTTTETITCSDEHYFIATIGYTASELDTFELRWFERGSNFGKPAGTFLIVGNIPIETKGDTIVLREPGYSSPLPEGAQLFTYHHDMELYIPASGRTCRISNIQDEGEHHATVKKPRGARDVDGCENSILSYTLDGTQHTFAEYKPTVYISK